MEINFTPFKTILTCLFLSISLHSMARPTEPVVIYVDIDAQGNNDGSDWTNAYTDLQNAIAAAIQ